jgi:hypothetical protein
MGTSQFVVGSIGSSVVLAGCVLARDVVVVWRSRGAARSDRPKIWRLSTEPATCSGFPGSR